MKNTHITESDVVAFLQEKQAELRAKIGVDYSTITAGVDGATSRVKWGTYADGGNHMYAETLAEAMEAQAAILTPAARAAALRERAALLLLDAAKLEGKK